MTSENLEKKIFFSSQWKNSLSESRIMNKKKSSLGISFSVTDLNLNPAGFGVFGFRFSSPGDFRFRSSTTSCSRRGRRGLCAEISQILHTCFRSDSVRLGSFLQQLKISCHKNNNKKQGDTTTTLELDFGFFWSNQHAFTSHMIESCFPGCLKLRLAGKKLEKRKGA